MKPQKWIIVLVVLNAVLLFGLAAQPRPVAPADVQSIVRARAIELVDERGRVRASLNVAENGEAVFRLRDANETIRLKLGASEKGSALLLLDGATNPALHVLANSDTTTMTLSNKDGRKRVIEP